MTLFPRLNWVIILSVMAIAVCPFQAIAEIPSTKIEFIRKSLSALKTEKVEFPSQKIAESSRQSKSTHQRNFSIQRNTRRERPSLSRYLFSVGGFDEKS